MLPGPRLLQKHEKQKKEKETYMKMYGTEEPFTAPRALAAAKLAGASLLC